MFNFCRKANALSTKLLNLRYFSSGESTIGFIGLGQMGNRMAVNLVKKGQKVLGFDISNQNLEQFEKSGGHPVTSLDSLSTCSVVITMLPSNPHVKDTYLENTSSLLKIMKSPSLFIDSSTIDPSVSRSIYDQVKSKGHEMVDAPVSGGVLGAEAGTLTFMVGGTSDAFERSSPILKLMGKNIVYCGGPGNGQVAKVCNNLVLGISMIGVSEAMNLGIRLGIDPKILTSIFNTSSARCWSSDTYNPVPGVIPGVPSSRGYSGGFGVDLMAKDLGLAVGAANAVKAPLILGASAHQIYNTLGDKGYGNLDFSSVYDFLKKND